MKEFQDFQATCNKNFLLMQKNFDELQTTLRHLLLEPNRGEEEEVVGDQSGQESVQPKESLITTLVAIPPVSAKQLPGHRLQWTSLHIKQLDLPP